MQDSALDTLSEARRAVLSDLPHPEYPAVSTSDPLQQARKLVRQCKLGLQKARSACLCETERSCHVYPEVYNTFNGLL